MQNEPQTGDAIPTGVPVEPPEQEEGEAAQNVKGFDDPHDVAVEKDAREEREETHGG